MTVRVPTLRYENVHWRDGAVRVAGIDEVGVAPTCGAVVAAAVIMKPHARRHADGVTRCELGQVGADLVGGDLVQDVHGGGS